jgi:hypothetical protein
MADMNTAQVDGTASLKTVQDKEPASTVNHPSADEQTNGTGGLATADEADATTQKHAEVDGGLGLILKGSAFESSPSETANAGAVAQPNSAKSKPAAKQTSASQSASLATRMKDARKEPPPKGNFIASKNAISVLPPGGRIRPLASTKSPTTPKSPQQKTSISPNAQKPKPAHTNESEKTTSKTLLRSPTLPKPEHKPLATAGPKATQPIKTKASDAVPQCNGVKKDISPTSPKSKARPRSPTRPARLPAAAAAPTTASVAKTSSAPNRPASRASTTAIANGKNLTTSQHNRSIAKLPNSATAASLAKKTSRASLASQAGSHDLPKSRTSIVTKAPDEGFLARLTRPTASFAQKTHEKLQVHSPPRERKPAAKPKLRKSTGKLEDEKESAADTNGTEDHGAQDTTADSNGIVEGAVPQAEISAQPLAAGQHGVS